MGRMSTRHARRSSLIRSRLTTVLALSLCDDQRMPNDFKATVVVDRPIEDVFAFLADGENDPKFSPRVLEMAKTTDGPPAVGTRFASTVKDAGMKTKREFEYTEFVRAHADPLDGALEEPRHGDRGRL